MLWIFHSWRYERLRALEVPETVNFVSACDQQGDESWWSVYYRSLTPEPHKISPSGLPAVL